ncbi:MAG: DUF1570 domain-containing protein [Phycisphaerales bacterium]|nr:DUF1570 domain-containing protein [Phycisphaerales bacterium]
MVSRSPERSRSLALRIGAAWLICLTATTVGWGQPEGPLPADPEAEAALLKDVGAGFSLKKTDNFLIAYNTRTSLVNQFAQRIEWTYGAVYRFCENNGIPTKRPTRRLEVIFFDAPTAYYDHVHQLQIPAEGTFGIYHYRSNRSMFFDVSRHPDMLELEQGIAAAQVNIGELQRQMREVRGRYTPVDITFADGRQVRLTRDQVDQELRIARGELKKLDSRRISFNTRINRSVIQHEIAHQVTFNAGILRIDVDNPKWIVEGLALMFETPPGGHGMGISGTNTMRLEDFRNAISGGDASVKQSTAEYLQAVEAGRIPSLHELISDSRLFEARGEDGATAYACTWALTHYLVRRDTPNLVAYLKALAERPAHETIPPSEELTLFEKHFGRIDDLFIDNFCRYILRIRL